VALSALYRLGFGSQNNTAARPAFGASTTTFGAPAASSGSLFGSACKILVLPDLLLAMLQVSI
jgi:hypothetical protein